MKTLLMDVGNTLIKIATVGDDKIISQWPVINTKGKDTKMLLTIAFKTHHQLTIDNAIISCVVPSYLSLLKTLVRTTFHCQLAILNYQLIAHAPLKIKLNNPQLGSDLMALAIGATAKYESVIVISLGTATTYTIIKNNTLVGVIIGPGISVSKNSLIANAALLSDFKIEHYASMLGTTTLHALSIGYGYGFNAMIKGTVNQINQELQTILPVVVTGGGGGEELKSYFDFNYDDEPQILLNGLFIISQHLLANK
ncbi:type III pantothenate kinase [Spiroplasma endosymbiont of Nebria brevicollis]|uniref:type III pantothenate kinase n=1 Tax=Spiroplasma endosymbiont of Nebria brevicollis TaxID=3066284 RepID=UPI00313C4A81